MFINISLQEGLQLQLSWNWEVKVSASNVSTAPPNSNTYILKTQYPILGPSTQWRAQQCKKVLLIFVNGTQSCCCWEGVAVFLELDLCPRHQLSPVGGLFLIPIFCFHFQMCFHFSIYSHFRAQFSIFFQQWHHWSWRKMDVVDNSCFLSLMFIQEKHFQKESVDFWHRKLTLKMGFLQFLRGQKELEVCN